MPGEVTIISTRQDAGFDVNSRPVETMRTEFRIGDDGPFVVRIPMSEWSAARVKEEIDRFRRELDTLRNV